MSSYILGRLKQSSKIPLTYGRQVPSKENIPVIWNATPTWMVALAFGHIHPSYHTPCSNNCLCWSLSSWAKLCGVEWDTDTSGCAIYPLRTEHGSIWSSTDGLEYQSIHIRHQLWAIKAAVTQNEQRDFRKESLIVSREQCFCHEGALCVPLTVWRLATPWHDPLQDI